MEKDKEIQVLKSEVAKGNLVIARLQQEIGKLHGEIAILQTEKEQLLMLIKAQKESEEKKEEKKEKPKKKEG